MSRLRNCKWLKVILCLVLAGILTFSVLFSVVLCGGHDQIKGEPEVMLILGCQVYPWGPSVLLKDRLDEALGYLNEREDMTIIVSGGQGPDEHTSEAAVMQEYLVQAGIDAQRILTEDQSHNTMQNLTYSARLMDEKGLDPEQGVLIVSNAFHLTRARMLWDRVTGAGQTLSTLAAPSSHLPSRLWMYIREPLALVKSFCFDH